MAGTFRNLLASDRLIRVASVGRIPHPVLIEMIGLAGGYDGIWLDQEHAGLTTEQITIANLAAQASGLASFVRLATFHYSLVNQALESGVDGVMAARVHSAEEAEQFVRWCKFAPRGMRGMNSGGADAAYSHKPLIELAETANREQMVAIQIETIAAVSEVNQIAALADVDMLFVGPADLGQELGALGQPHDPHLWDAIDEVVAACRQHGKAWGTVAPDPEFAARAVDKECRMLTFGSDVESVRRGFDAIQDRFSDFFDGR